MVKFIECRSRKQLPGCQLYVDDIWARNMKLFAALGPGDIVGAQQNKKSIVSSEPSILYSGQFVEYCRSREIRLLAISQNSRRDSLIDGLLQIENRPRIFENRGGVRHHISLVAYALYLAFRARKFGADMAIINHGTAYYFALFAFWALRIPVAINFHGTLWPNGFRPRRRLDRLIMALNAIYFRFVPIAASGVCPECGIQVRELAGPNFPFFDYRAQFRKEGFRSSLRDHNARPFRVAFVGRAEEYKGVLDIALIAEQVRKRCQMEIIFDVVGDGGALGKLRQLVQSKALEDVVRFMAS